VGGGQRAASLVATLACAALACLPASSLASVHAHDSAATRTYLAADNAYERSAYAELGVRVAASETRASEIGAECPSALTYAPRDMAFGELGEEAETTAYFGGVTPVLSMNLRLAQAIEHLRWTDRRLTRLVRAEVAEERGIATLELPDVCADIAAWKASGYEALPETAARFLARAHGIESLSEGVGPSEEPREAAIMRRLRPYESPVDRQTAKRIERLEAQIDKRLRAAGTTAEKKLAAALGVSAL
jgi:hypothetical protein